jgi:hypothetical protein
MAPSRYLGQGGTALPCWSLGYAYPAPNGHAAAATPINDAKNGTPRAHNDGHRAKQRFAG